MTHCEVLPGNSQFWNCWMSVKDNVYTCCERVVKSTIWDDAWLSDKPFSQLLPSLYNWTSCQNVTIANVFQQDFNCNRFSRCLYGNTLHLRNKLLDMCSQVTLTVEPVKVMKVIYRCIMTLHLWSSLLRVENQDMLTKVCTRLKATARDTFTQRGWQHDLRIGPPLDSTCFFVFRLLFFVCMRRPC